jgi:hypothetical protein
VAATETTTFKAIVFQAAMARTNLERGDQFTRFISILISQTPGRSFAGAAQSPDPQIRLARNHEAY